MALTSNGLTNGGLTAHYQFQYDTSLAGASGAGTTNQAIAGCEADFNQMSGWFGNISPNVNNPILVNVIPPGQPNACPNNGACWGISSSGTLTVTVSVNNLTGVLLRYLIVAEVVERFMQVQNAGWWGQGTEGSQGEGLSRFLAGQFLAINGLGNTPPAFNNSNAWLNSSRADYVNNINPTDDGPDAITGCSLLFIYYLFSQLGYSIEAIVAAGANPLGGQTNLAGVYRNLVSVSDNPFPAFKRVLDIYFPGTSTITKGNLDNPFPLRDPPLTSPGILWHHGTTHETQIWLMNSARVARRETVLGQDGNPTFIGPPFTIVATGDFDRDGTTDILWHNGTSQETQIWFMNGSRVSGRATVLGEDGNPTFIGPPFRIVGVGDFDRNGPTDILWHHSTTHETQIWFMNGARVARRQTVLGEDGNPTFIGPPFRIVGVGDFKGNGPTDILWHNSTTHETQIWFMNGPRVAGRATVLGEDGRPTFIGPPFTIVATGDFDRDGTTDILWHNSATHETQIWFMNGPRVARRQTVLGENGNPTFIGPPFNIVGTGVFASELPWQG